MSKYKITLIPRLNMTNAQVVRATQLITDTQPRLTSQEVTRIMLGMIENDKRLLYESDQLPGPDAADLFYVKWQYSDETPMQRVQREQNDLLECGANGDEQAAIEYCQLALSGKIVK